MNLCSISRENQNSQTWTDQWRLQCEARYLLSMPLEQRREALEMPARAKRVKALKEEMQRQFNARKPAA